MERNSDVVVLSCYAPLFVNVSPGAMQWKSDLIGYDAQSSFGSPSYYVQKMFATNLGDRVAPILAANVPTQTWQPPTPRARAGDAPPSPPAPRQVPTLFFVATTSGKKATTYVKVVNTAGTTQVVRIQLTGARQILPAATAITLRSDRPEDTNSFDQPTRIVPTTTQVTGIGPDFRYSFAPYSVTVLVIGTR